MVEWARSETDPSISWALQLASGTRGISLCGENATCRLDWTISRLDDANWTLEDTHGQAMIRRLSVDRTVPWVPVRLKGPIRLRLLFTSLDPKCWTESEAASDFRLESGRLRYDPLIHSR